MATAKRRMVLPLALAVGAMGLMVMTSIAGARRPRPQGATSLLVPLVPAFKQCATTNRTHGPPLAFPSCNPPVPSSNFVTVGTPDANGAPGKSQGFVKVAVRAVQGRRMIIRDRDHIADHRRSLQARDEYAWGNANTDWAVPTTRASRTQTPRSVSLHHDNSTTPGGGPRCGHWGGHPFSIVNIPCVLTPSKSANSC